MRILAAMDKFKGTLNASEAAAAACAGAEGHECDPCPVADGGDGTLEAFGGANRTSAVVGPHGDELVAGWRLNDRVAVIEMAAASGLIVAGNQQDPIEATTYGTGQLIAVAIEAGAESILVGVGGSATTDGGAGAIEALASILVNGRLPSPVKVLCDVTVPFTDAARIFGPQKGATPDQVAELTRRLENMRADWMDTFDVDRVAGSGAAGGLAGGLASIGAELAPGFSVIADHLGLPERIGRADLVVTGEGSFDRTSLQGKAVGGVIKLADQAGKPVLVIAGSVIAESVTAESVTAGSVNEASGSFISLVEQFGDAAWTDPAGCIETATRQFLDRWHQGKR